jgi:hypothetical protein
MTFRPLVSDPVESSRACCEFLNSLDRYGEHLCDYFYLNTLAHTTVYLLPYPSHATPSRGLRLLLKTSHSLATHRSLSNTNTPKTTPQPQCPPSAPPAPSVRSSSTPLHQRPPAPCGHSPFEHTPTTPPPTRVPPPPTHLAHR